MKFPIEAWFRIVAENSIRQDEVKRNSLWVNALKNASWIYKQERSFEKIISMVANLHSDTKTAEESTGSTLQVILALSGYTPKDTLFHLGVNISEFRDIKSNMVVVGFSHRWVKRITE